LLVEKLTCLVDVQAMSRKNTSGTKVLIRTQSTGITWQWVYQYTSTPLFLSSGVTSKFTLKNQTLFT
jgi:hypothetical protein